MEKKIIQSLYANVVAKDELRPIMNGVHFESERCYASDGHVLVIYEEGKPELEGKTMSASGEELEGKTMSASGEELEGRYPNVDSVFPNEENYGKKLVIDILQLRNACKWQTQQEDANENDNVVIGNVGYNIRTLMRICNVMLTSGNPRHIKFYNSDPNRPTVIIGTKLKGLVMPMQYEEANIDSEREEEGYTRTYSYENLVNEYVFNGWKKPEKKQAIGWLD